VEISETVMVNCRYELYVSSKSDYQSNPAIVIKHVTLSSVEVECKDVNRIQLPQDRVHDGLL
jgi:hypothetical protein